MTSKLQRLCAWLLLCLCQFAHADGARPGDTPTAILERLERHGFVDPMNEAARIDAVLRSGAAAGIDEVRLHAALAAMYIAADRKTAVEQELAWLARAARNPACTPCRQWHEVRRIQWIVRRHDVVGLAREEKRLKELTTSKDPLVRQFGLYLAAGASDARGDHRGTIEHGMKALRLAEELDVPAEQVRALNIMMVANIAERNLEQAQSYAREALVVAERIGFTYMVAYLRANQAWIYSLLDQPADELAALRAVEAITDAHKGLDHVLLVNTINFAEYYVRQRQFEQARAHAAAAVSMALAQGKSSPQASALHVLGKAQLGLGRQGEGIRTLEQAVALMREIGATSYLADALDSLVEAREGAGDVHGALATLHALARLKDEMHARDRDHALLAAQERFKTERKDREIERLSLENARRSAEVAASTAQQRLWVLVAIVAVLGVLGMAYTIARALARNRVLQQSNAHLSSESEHDPLTGAYNRRYCEHRMDGAAATTRSTGLILLDVDHFKRVNDTYGHPAGDEVLVQAARRLSALLRELDAVVRWGGEEFLLIVEGTSQAHLHQLCARVLAAIADQPVVVDGVEIPVTVSLGAAVFPAYPGQEWRDLVALVDGGLYRAKKTGRNRAVVLAFDPALPPPAQPVKDLDAAEAAGLLAVTTISGSRPAGAVLPAAA